MTAHRCHLPGCENACPPRWLMCYPHWKLVPKPLADEVYRTVRMRGKSCDATWAPWWRAQAEAIASVGRQVYPSDESVDRWLARELNIAAKLEAMR